ncbi:MULTISPECIES: hypothetical protein [unclassified Roseitalea]|uniref:hypothetical protein n=1 Tax=unclassified Roseitalea TaxID=2639107 RepID=UPI00273EDD75|nr:MULTISPECIES: hypothetical protein [unclassified Roseitalea]
MTCRSRPWPQQEPIDYERVRCEARRERRRVMNAVIRSVFTWRARHRRPNGA